MKIETNVLLSNLTTFKIGGNASYFALVSTEGELVEAIAFARQKKIPWFVLGGGSNLLVDDQGYAGLVIKLDLKGIEFEDQGQTVKVKAAASEQWDGLVETCVSRGLYGLENLSGIPGTVGAAPVQNIGAYGAEVKDSISAVEVFNTEIVSTEVFSNAECRFSYRDSLFKKLEGKKYIILRVTFILKKEGVLHIDYKDVKNYFESRMVQPSLSLVRTAIIDIRKSKFPSLEEYGTAGSFFKNPIIERSRYQSLLVRYPTMPHYAVDTEFVKIPLAWILDNVCNIKGVRKGNVGAYEKQALVLVNFGGASSQEVKTHANEIIDMVKEKTGIVIEPEVQYLQ